MFVLIVFVLVQCLQNVCGCHASSVDESSWDGVLALDQRITSSFFFAGQGTSLSLVKTLASR